MTTKSQDKLLEKAGWKRGSHTDTIGNVISLWKKTGVVYSTYDLPCRFTSLDWLFTNILPPIRKEYRVTGVAFTFHTDGTVSATLLTGNELFYAFKAAEGADPAEALLAALCKLVEG